jgi:ferredoxin--NADP+ reductase
VRAVKLVRNEILNDDGWPKAQATDDHETLECGLVFRSVGYRGVPLPGLPFDERRGLIPNEQGRVREGDRTLPGLYVAGWIKRGPTGVIGTNKADASDTVVAMLADLEAGGGLSPAEPTLEALPQLLAERGVRIVDYADWQAIDRAEVERASADERPRVKMIRLEEFLAAID